MRKILSGELLARHIRTFVHSLIVKRPLKSVVAAIVLCAAFFTLATHSGFAGTSRDPTFEAKKAEVFKKFKVQVAKPNEFPITVFPTDKVPPVMHDPTYAGDIAWLDNETIMYVPQTDIPPARIREEAGLLSLVSVNLQTFERKEIAKVSTDRFCYDYGTHNVRYVGVIGEGISKQRAVFYGKLGEPLKSDFRVKLPDVKQPQNWTHTIDCTYYPVLPPPGDIGRSAIRIADGYVGHEEEYGQTIPGSYLFRDSNGNFKTLKLGQSNLADFHFDAFSNSYWYSEDTHWEKGQTDGIKVWRLNRRFEVTSEEFYRRGPWAFGYPLTTSVRPGFIVNGALYGGDKLTTEARIHDLTYLISKGGIIKEIAEDIGARFAISPDGCKAITTKLEPLEHGSPQQTGELLQIDFCHKS